MRYSRLKISQRDPRVRKATNTRGGFARTAPVLHGSTGSKPTSFPQTVRLEPAGSRGPQASQPVTDSHHRGYLGPTRPLRPEPVQTPASLRREHGLWTRLAKATIRTHLETDRRPTITVERRPFPR